MPKILKLLGSSLRGWLFVAASLLTLFLCFQMFFHSPPKGKAIADLMPAPGCPGSLKSSAKALDRQYATGLYQVRYTIKGCNAVSSDTGAQVIENVLKGKKKLAAIGFPIPKTRIVFGAIVQPKDAVVTYPDALVSGAYINAYQATGRNQLITSQTLAEIALASMSPGLSKTERARVASAEAILATNQGSFYQNELRQGIVTPETLGVFDAWVAAQGHFKQLTNAITKCAQSCDWPSTYSKELRRDHVNMSKVAKIFTARSITGHPDSKRHYARSITSGR